MNRHETTAVRESQPLREEAEPAVVEHPRDRRKHTSLARRVLAALIMVLTLAGALTVIPVSTASAATQYATATVCFTQRGGGAFNGQVATDYYTSDQGWYRAGVMTLPTSGCQTVYLVPGFYVRFTVTHSGFYGLTSSQPIYNGYHYTFRGVAYW
jgi:hypothetical protein